MHHTAAFGLLALGPIAVGTGGFCTGILYQTIQGRAGLVVSPLFSSEDDGTRTRNHRIDSPLVSRSKSQPDKQIAPSGPAGCSAGCSDQTGEGGIPDADLAALVAAWPTMPDHIRAAVRALVGTVTDPS